MTAGSTQQANYYEVLGANPMDQLDRIEDLFRQLAYDAEQSGDHSKVPLAVEAFKVLRDPSRRHQYDLHLSQQHIAAAPQDQQVQQGQQHIAAAPQDQQVQQGQQHEAAAQQIYQHQPQETAAQQHQQVQQGQPQETAAQQHQQVQQGQQHEAATEQIHQHQPQETAAQQHQQVQQGQQHEAAAQQVQQRQPQDTVQPQDIAQPHAAAVQPHAAAVAPAQPIAPVAAPEQAASVEATNEPPPEFCAKTALRRRREVLAMFYKRRRDNAKNPGIAIGGIEQKVDYTYETLEFHLWYMQQRELIFRLESGMFTITYLGVEEHEKNLIEGLIR